MAIDNETKKLWAGDVWAINGDRAEVEAANPAPTIIRNIGFQQSFSVDQTLNREKMNQILCELYSAAQKVKEGISPWDATVSYPPGAVTKIATTLYYQNSSSDNTGTNPSTPGQSVWINLGSSGTPSTSAPPAMSASDFFIDGSRADRFNVRWSAPNTGGASITEAEVRYSKTNPPPENSSVQGAYTQGSAITITGNDSDLYYVQVRLRNSIGWGGWSTAKKVRSSALIPLGPDWITANKAGSGAINVAWSGTRDNGLSITQHTVQWKSGTQNYNTSRQKIVTNNAGYGAGNTTITGLTNGTTYTFRVIVRSSRGTTNPSPDATGTPTQSPSAPDAPTVGSTGLSPTSAIIFANANINNNGATITQFRFQHKLSTQAWSAATTSTSSSSLKLITGLTAGATYDFRIQATNSAGDGNYTTGTISLTSASAPGKPTAKVFRTGEGSAIYCLANANITANAPITSYRMRYRATGASTWGADTETTDAAAQITGLVSATTYELQIGARTSANWGDWSDSVTIPAFSAGNVAPSGVSAASAPGKANGTVVVGNQGVINPGSSAVHSFTWQYRPTLPSNGTWTDANFQGVVGPDPLFGVITGLTAGTSYQFQLIVRNAQSSTTSAITTSVATAPPAVVVSAPTNIVAKAERGPSGIMVVGLGASPGDGNGTLTNWKWEYKLSTANTWTALSPSAVPTRIITGLTNDSQYNFRVSVTNAHSTVTSNSINAIPRSGLPAAKKPSNVSIGFFNTTSGTTVLLLNRDMDDGGASPVSLKWEYKRNTSSTWIEDDTTTETFNRLTGLNNSYTYDARVTATNSAGSTISNTISFSPRDPAGSLRKPSSVVAVANVGRSGEIIVSLGLDTVSDRTLITNYRWSYRKSSESTWTNLTESTNPTQSITGLEAGTAYSFYVRAANVQGTTDSPVITATPVNHIPAAQSPSNVVASATAGSNGSVVLGLGADTDGRGANITGYRWQWKVRTSNTWGALTPSSTNPSYTATGLTVGTAYDFRVQATNSVGTTTSASVQATPIVGGPSDHAPRSVSIRAAPTSSRAIIAYINGDIDGGLNRVSSYSWQYKKKTDSNYTSGGSNAFMTANNLENDTAYDVRLTATNSTGSTTANTSVTPRDPEGSLQKPSDVVAMAFTAGTGEIVVTIGKDTVSDRTSVTGYTWEYKTSTASTWTSLSSSTNPSRLISNLTVGTTYNFRVTAANTAGTTTSSQVNATPVNHTPAAKAPSGVVASATAGSNGSVVLGLAKDPLDNGSSITGFQWQWKTKTSNTWGTFSTSSTNPTFTVTGLTIGTIYQFRVKATNGVGSFTSPSVEATPITGGPAATAPKNAQVRVAYTGSGQVLMYQRGDIDNGGSPITNYQWQYKLATSSTWIGGSSGTLGYGTISGLTNGTSYHARLVVTNNVGSNTSPTRSFTPRDPAGSINNPSSVVAAAFPAGTGQVLVSLGLDTVSDRSTISGYVWQYKEKTASTWKSLSSSTNPTRLISNLTAGTAYSFRVTATNTQGSTTSGSVDATPVNHNPSASAPSNITATATPGRSGQVVVGMGQDPLNGGSTITAFKWEYKLATSNTWTSAGTSTNPTRTITGLTNGTAYNFRVSATNSVGTTTSSSVNATPVSGLPANTAPVLSSILTRTGASGTIDAYYGRDVRDGGAAITKFEWRTQDSTNNSYSSWRSTGVVPAVRFTGLTNGRLYYIEGRAVNSVSTTTTTSEQRGSARPVVPAVSSSAPSNVKAVAHDSSHNSIVVGLLEDVNDNNSPITGFVWRYKRSSDSTWTSTSSSIKGFRQILGLSPDTNYDFQVTATNARGSTTSATYTEQTRVAPLLTPSAPSIGSISAEKGGSGEIIVGIESGFRTNGSALNAVRYQYKRTTSSTWIDIGNLSASDLTRKVSGLTNGTAYHFRGRFQNASGTTTSPIVTATPGGTAITAPGKPVLASSNAAGDHTTNTDYSFLIYVDSSSVNDGGSPITDVEWKFSRTSNSNGSSATLIAPSGSQSSYKPVVNSFYSPDFINHQMITPYMAYKAGRKWLFSPTGSTASTTTVTESSSNLYSRRWLVAQVRWRNNIGWGPWSDAKVYNRYDS